MGFHISLFPPPSPYESFDYASVRFSARHVHSRRRLRHQVRLTQAQAAPRMQDALVGLEDALTDQIAWLENAAEDDKADAEASGEAERERQSWRPLRAA